LEDVFFRATDGSDVKSQMSNLKGGE